MYRDAETWLIIQFNCYIFSLSFDLFSFDILLSGRILLSASEYCYANQFLPFPVPDYVVQSNCKEHPFERALLFYGHCAVKGLCVY